MNEACRELGSLCLHLSLFTTWGVMAALLALSWLVNRHLAHANHPLRIVAETLYTMMDDTVRDVVPEAHREVTPFIATLWIFLVVANLVGLIPGLHSPTADLSVTAALAAVVFSSVHWFAIRSLGLRAHLRHYLAPSPLLLPFHLISELTRTLALAIRLFGNIMSLEMAALLVLMVAGFLVPIPLLMLHIIEALIQAYIFGILALLYIGSGLETLAEPRAEPPP
jgi:F-type H+-transporting ATPase subunit a